MFSSILRFIVLIFVLGCSTNEETQTINNFSSDLKYFIQLVNRFEFKKINSQKIGLKETVYIYQSNVLCYYFIINETEQIINHFNQYDRIILQSEEIKKNEDNIIIPSNEYVIYYKKIKN